MSIRQLILYAVCLTHFAVSAQTFSPSAPNLKGPLTLNQALEAAKLNALSKLSQQDLAAANSDILAADRAPLPIFSAKATATDSATHTTTSQALALATSQRKNDKSWGLDWTLERGGKRTHRTDAAKFNAQAAEAEFAETQIQQQLVAKDSFYDLLSAQERTHHLKAIAVAAEATASATKLRAKAGDLSLQDMMRVEIEAERAMSDYRKSQLEEKRASYALAQSLGFNTPTGQTLKVALDWPQSTQQALEPSQSLEAYF
jgi:outer membrane protein TolC